jgi:GyrI-like small molecule binding domain
MVGATWGPATGKVWPFIRSQPGPWTNGHNIFLYQHPAHPGAPILCDFGVEVTRTFETAGEVYATETPAGEVAVAVHRGPYDRMNETHDAIRKRMAENGRESAGVAFARFGFIVGNRDIGRRRGSNRRRDCRVIDMRVVSPDLAAWPSGRQMGGCVIQQNDRGGRRCGHSVQRFHQTGLRFSDSAGRGTIWVADCKQDWLPHLRHLGKKLIRDRGRRRESPDAR